MRVVVTDRRFSNPAWEDTDRYYHPEPYEEVVETKGGELVYGDFETEDEVVEGCRDADVVITYRAPITRRVIEAMGEAELIICNAAGFDIIDVHAATEHGIPVSALRGYVNQEMAEHTVALALAAAKDIVHADRVIRSVDGWGDRGPIKMLNHGTFGIIGLGEIGRSVIPKARGLGMDVIATDPYMSDSLFADLGVERTSLNDLLTRADCVSIHCQLTAETHHLISTDEFARMQETAVLVNTARGPIVDEEALVEAIETGEIWNAGIDVYETEPPTDTPALSCERIVCSPHHGGITISGQQYDRAIEIIRRELVLVLDGEHPQNIVNPEALKYGEDLINPELESWRD